MPATTMIAAMMLQAISVPGFDEPVYAETDVGFEELTQGRAADAIETIRANDELAADDPSALINLGTAHKRMGQNEKAMEYYLAAANSDRRYELELSDGRWMDSKRAATLAIRSLATQRTFAAR